MLIGAQGTSSDSERDNAEKMIKGALESNSLWEFDDRATRVMWGFASVEDYYQKSSSCHFIQNIRIPLLCINALDDPLVPESCIPFREFTASTTCILATTNQGGHVAFLEDLIPWSIHSSWADSFSLGYLVAILEGDGS